MEKKRNIKKIDVIGPLVAFILLFIVFAITTDRFFTVGNLRNVMLQVCIVSLLAIGETIVIIGGGIDISLGSSITLLTMVLAALIKFLGIPLPIAIGLVILIGIILGIINGAITAYVGVPAFITTLATQQIFRGFAFTLNNGTPIQSLSPFLQEIFYGTIFGLPIVVVYVVIFYVLAAIFMRYTETGRSIFAVGGNRAAARFSGINDKFITFFTFTIAGLMSAIAAILFTARLDSGSPNYGVGMESNAIAAAVIGGASLAGGKGNIIGTLIGSMIIVIVQNALNLNSIPTAVQSISLGVIITLAVALDIWGGKLKDLTKKIVLKNN